MRYTDVMTIDDEVRRATKLLETVMQAAGLTRKDLDQKLGAGPGYVSQVLTGRMELKLRHVLAILRALEVEPSVFFQTLYPENRPSTDAVVMEEFLRRFQRLGFGSQPAPPAPALDTGELEKLIRSAVRSALSEPPEPAGPDSREEGEPRGERPGKSKPPNEENGKL
ncbi:MAG TPA: helix-turn-helix transcriptional regulator [Thermoanaerobaculia bacterium]|nr:helix-turn-helix transcriptional regulator [Thermoanaerobaculia bacterium]